MQEAVASRTCDISLVVTDVVMPEMNRKELTERLRRVCPEVKALFISGYTGTTLEHRRMFEQDIDFMQKPFTSQEFSAKIREILGSK